MEQSLGGCKLEWRQLSPSLKGELSPNNTNHLTNVYPGISFDLFDKIIRCHWSPYQNQMLNC